MDICFYCLAMVLVSTIVGALLSYLFFRSGSRKVIEERDELSRISELSNSNLNRITDEYNQYKAKATQRIEDGEAEINKLNRLNLSLSSAKPAGLTQSELDHKYLKWKKRSEDLSSELEYLRAKVDFDKDNSPSTPVDDSQLTDLKSQLGKALKKIRKQDIQLMEAESNIINSTKKKGTGKKKKKIKELKAELTAIKSKLKKKK